MGNANAQFVEPAATLCTMGRLYFVGWVIRITLLYLTLLTHQDFERLHNPVHIVYIKLNLHMTAHMRAASVPTTYISSYLTFDI